MYRNDETNKNRVFHVKNLTMYRSCLYRFVQFHSTLIIFNACTKVINFSDFF